MQKSFIRKPLGVLLAAVMLIGMCSAAFAIDGFTLLPKADSDSLEAGAYWFDEEGMIAEQGVDEANAAIMREQYSYYLSDDGNTIRIVTRVDSFDVSRTDAYGAVYFSYLKQHVAAFDYAAQIGTLQYETLEEALENTDDGDVVTILRDVDEPDAFADLGYYSTVELDLNGCEVTFGCIDTMGGLTIRNGSLDIATLSSYNAGNQYALTIDGAQVVVFGGFSWMATDISLLNGSSLLIDPDGGLITFPGFNGVGYDTAVISIDGTSQIEIRNTVSAAIIGTYNYEALAAALEPYLPDGVAFDADESSYTCGKFYWTDDTNTDPVYPVILKQWGEHEHVYDETDWTDNVFADCGNDGSVGYFTCRTCGARIDTEGNVLTDEDIRVPATGDHSWEWVEDQAAGCYTDGVQHEYCSVCGHVQSENTPIPAAHEFEEWVDAVPATCGSDGTLGYQRCTVCGDYFDEEENKLDSIVDPATGVHVWQWVIDTPATCGDAGVKHQKCRNCPATQAEGTVIAPTGDHNYVWVIDLEPTDTEDGLKHEECTVCGAKRNENTVIPALGEEDGPEAPDDLGGASGEACPLCGRHHGQWGVLGQLIGAIHIISLEIRNLLGK
ncbi:MAG: hypothetical protein K6C36_07705 [Clostridia bacterium]|nr:hypothetical protein [Clostridia bacterium]